MGRTSLAITDCFASESPLATELRRLFQNLQRSSSDQELKSVMVTSAIGGEGKSTLASLLGITAARRGFKTILLDCDLRRPSLHDLFLLERERGMAEILSEGLQFKRAIKKTSLDKLDLVTAGKAISHPSEIFDSRAIASLIGELKFYYDFAVIDTPPVMPVSDPMLLAPELDGVLLVIKAGDTDREVAKRATEILAGNKANILGAVLNNAKGSLPYYFNYSHYQYDPVPGSGKPAAKTGPSAEPSDKSKHDAGNKTDSRHLTS